jgi:serine-type D-Ala-D-Ala carboxypeptidase
MWPGSSTIRDKIRSVSVEGQLRAFLDELARLGGVVSGLEAIVADADRILFRHAAGFRVGGERLVAGSGARFDAASLTKPWMAALALSLGEEGTRGLLGDLLRHRSGAPPWTLLGARMGRRVGDPAALRSFLLKEVEGGNLERASRASPGREEQRVEYSDLGYILWGLLVEEASGRNLGELLDERVCAPLGIAPLGRNALAGEVAAAVECRLDNGREVELAAAQGITLARQRSFLLGVPQDGNARALRAVGLLPAHAGLFVTADEMLVLAREWLRPGRLLDGERVAAALSGEGSYALGWARWSAEGSAGPALSGRSFGHTGFTGGSVWIDPERDRICVLLAHRLSSRIDFNPCRREFHRLATEAAG